MNPAGSLASSNATLTVLIPASILENPQSRAIRATSNVTFSVSASSTSPISYQWYFNHEAARVNLQEIPGATASAYTIQSVDLPNRGFYRVRVTDSVGSLFSQPAELTVLIDPTYILQPIGAAVPAASRW